MQFKGIERFVAKPDIFLIKLPVNLFPVKKLYKPGIIDPSFADLLKFAISLLRNGTPFAS